MIWVGLALFVAIVLVGYEVYGLRVQTEGLGRLLYGINKQLREANELLREIAQNTERMPKAG